MKDDIQFKIKQIESEYPVSTIECDGIKIWPFIRWTIFVSYLREESLVKNKILGITNFLNSAVSLGH
jgi:hypothetical protein